MTWVPLGASRLASIQQFKRASKDGQLPVLIRAGFATDRALTTWQPEILEERYGEAWIRVHVQHSKFNIHEWTRDRKAYASKFPDRRMSIRGMKLRRFLQGLKKRGPTQIIRSIAGISIEELSRGQHPSLPKFCRRLGCTFVTAWSAPRSGRHWSLHQDDCPVFMGLVFGVKRVTIATPSSAKNLYLHPHNALLSSIPHVRNIDPRKFPKAMGVEFLEAALLPGDLLYIPARWWHQVDYIEPSMSFSYWPAKRHKG